MTLAFLIADLDQTGHADVLREQLQARPAYHEYYEPSTTALNIPDLIYLSYPLSPRHLNLNEQQAFDRALRRSVRLVHKATVIA